jgi:hypothetical protein
MVTPRSIDHLAAVGLLLPTMSRKMVDLPEPLGPTRPIFSPLKTPIDASSVEEEDLRAVLRVY